MCFYDKINPATHEHIAQKITYFHFFIKIFSKKIADLNKVRIFAPSLPYLRILDRQASPVGAFFFMVSNYMYGKSYFLC
jgi:hypothetical protein